MLLAGAPPLGTGGGACLQAKLSPSHDTMTNMIAVGQTGAQRTCGDLQENVGS